MALCWAGELEQFEAGSPEWIEILSRVPGTCVLEEGHEGPHIFTPDDQIVITFQ